MSSPLLAVLVAPLVSLLILLLLPRRSALATRAWAVALSAACTLGSLSLLGLSGTGGFEQEVDVAWIPAMGARFHLGVDGYSALLIVMSFLLTTLAIASSEALEERGREYFAYYFFLQFAVTGVFASLDFLLFFFFFEMSLLPMYFVVAGWGGPRRSYASMKFLVFTLMGSVLMLLAGVTVYLEHERQTGVASFGLADLLHTPLPTQVAWWVFAGLALGFAVKIPMVPLHTWLPDAHVEAPTGGSVILAGVLLKLGTYGLTRWGLPLVPEVARSGSVIWWMGALSITAILYGGLLCLTQKDWKKLVAYSSVAHMGFATLGLFSLTREGTLGSMMEQLNHGLSTPLLFILVGAAYQRMHTRKIEDFGGLLTQAPRFSAVLLIAVISSMGAPPFNGFMGEVPILQGAWQMSPVWALAAMLGLVLGVAYLWWMFQRVVFGEAKGRFADLSTREMWICAPLVVGIVVIGVVPQPVFSLLEGPAQRVVAEIHRVSANK